MAGEFVWTGLDYIGEPTPFNWPNRSSSFGIVDIAGFPKDRFYLYQSKWRPEPVVHTLPHWNWPDQFKGKAIPVWAYTNADSVNGLAIVVLRASRAAGALTLTARADGVAPAAVRVNASLGAAAAPSR